MRERAGQALGPYRYAGYGLALVAAGISTAIRVALTPVLGNLAPGVTFVPGVIAAAWFGGLGAGVACTVFSYLFARYVLVTPGSLVIDSPQQAAQLILNVFAGILISWITAGLRKARARAEQTQREASAILDSVSDGFIALDDQFRLTYMNSAAERLASHRRAELLGKTLWEVYPAILSTAAETQCRRAMTERLPIVFENLYESCNRWFEIHAEPTSSGGLSVYFRDITERKLQEMELPLLNRELSRRVEELETILNLAPVGLTIAGDPNGQHIRANAHQEKLMGTPAEAASYYLYLDGRELSTEQLPLWRALHEGRAVPPAEYKVVQPGGTEAFILAQATPLFEADGTIRGAVGACTDITERKRVEHSLQDLNRMLERSNADLQQFTYAVAHDLQEPLRTLTSYSALIAKRYRDKLDSDGEAMVDFLTGSGARMQALIRDLLTYCRAIEVPEDSVAAIECDEIVGYVLANLNSRVKESSATVTREGLPAVFMSRQQLMHVFQNLIGNALKYRREEPPRILLIAEQRESEWIFAVQDNGIGIDPAHRERIFGLFRRLHGSEIPGTGIGLAICKRIIEHHRGRIWVESAPGQGSTFFFALPGTLVAVSGAAQQAAG